MRASRRPTLKRAHDILLSTFSWPIDLTGSDSQQTLMVYFFFFTLFYYDFIRIRTIIGTRGKVTLLLFI